MTSSRPSRREAARARERSNAPNRWLLPVLGCAVIIGAAVLAVVLSGGLGGGGGGSSTLPSALPSASLPAGAEIPVITGVPLADFQNPSGDPAVGRPAPVVAGSAFDGSATGIAADGRPKVVMFLAHWCPHCQAEVPLVQDWLDANGAPVGVDLITVATAIDPNAPNYPPDAWLAREGWTVPVIVDPTNSVAGAYGLSAFPFWTFIGADGTVHARVIGELSIADLEGHIAELTGG